MQTHEASTSLVDPIRSLEFMVGEFVSLLTMWLPGAAPPVRYECFMRGSREGCERYVRTEFFSDPPGYGVESALFIHGFNRGHSRFQLHGFLTSCDEPLRLVGGWKDGSLVLISSPVEEGDGLQRYRHTYTPLEDGRWRFAQERWEAEGFARHVEGTFVLCPI